MKKTCFVSLLSLYLFAFSACAPKAENTVSPDTDTNREAEKEMTTDSSETEMDKTAEEYDEPTEDKMNYEEESAFEPGYPSSETIPYNGAWFDIEYPDNFLMVELEPSASMVDSYDGVGFISPDETVVFYIYSPQWGGTSVFEEVDVNEYIMDEKSETSGDTVNTWVTIADQNGEYYRSYHVVEQPDYGVRYVYGITYSSPEDYERYQSAYVDFKNSLMQYAD